MSRSDQKQVRKEAEAQNAQEYANSQNSYTKAQKDLTNYQDQLSQYAASDPYQAGGEYQTAENQVIANTADSAARTAGNELQAQALRTGGNTAAAGAQEEQIADQMERNAATQQAGATADRIDNEAKYKTNVLQANEFPVGEEAALSGQQGSEANGALGIQGQESNTPGFWDTLGDSFAHALGNTLGGGNLKMNANMNLGGS